MSTVKHLYRWGVLVAWFALGSGLLWPGRPGRLREAHGSETSSGGPTTQSPLRVKGPLSPRNASYQMRATLDEKTHRVQGKGRLTWRNLERQPVDRLVFHLYQNAFKNHASTFIFEAGPSLRGDEMPEGKYGYIDVTLLKVRGHDLLAGSTVDDTLLYVPLATPVPPSGSIEVELEWTTQLPGVFARSGWLGEFHAVTQWFPKIGVWDCDGGCRWRARQYHGSTEFFADFGNYSVEIDTAPGQIVGATGVQVAERMENGRHIERFEAEDVHDFAFFVDPRFLEVKDWIDGAIGEPPVAVRLLTRAGQEGHTARHLQALRGTIAAGRQWVGGYPYSNLTVVVPPFDGRGAGGMEYPTLIATWAMPLSAGMHDLDEVTAHEFGHQYFYGILATDETEEAFLDEGLNETFTGWAMDQMFGRCSRVDLPYLCLSTGDANWLAYRGTARSVPVGTRSFAVPSGFYGAVTYDHTALMMRTLEGYLGETRMRQAMKHYAERHRFGHPRRKDFEQALGESTGEDLSWFFTQALDTARSADYEVLDADSNEVVPAEGWWDCPPRALPKETGQELPTAEAREAFVANIVRSQQAACAGKPAGRHLLTAPDDHGKKDRSYQGTITVRRTGEFLFPVTVRAVFADGSSEEQTWSLAAQQGLPEQRVWVLTLAARTSPLRLAMVDPEGRLRADIQRMNNSKFVEPHRRSPTRFWGTFLGTLSTLFDLLGV